MAIIAYPECCVVSRMMLLESQIAGTTYSPLPPPELPSWPLPCRILSQLSRAAADEQQAHMTCTNSRYTTGSEA